MLCLLSFSSGQLLNGLSWKAKTSCWLPLVHCLVTRLEVRKRLKRKRPSECQSSLVSILFSNIGSIKSRPYVQSKCVCTKHCHKMRLLQSWHTAIQRGSLVDLNVLQKLFLIIWLDELYCHITSCFHCLDAPKYQSVLECYICWLVAHKRKDGKKTLKPLANTSYVCVNLAKSCKMRLSGLAFSDCIISKANVKTTFKSNCRKL